MPTPEEPQADNEQLEETLSALEPARWRQTLEEAGVTPAAAVRAETRERVSDLLQQLSSGLDALTAPVRRGMQALLDGLAGKSFGSLEANQAVAREVQDLLNRLGLRVACPKVGCGRSASVRCAAAGNSKEGVFQFDHTSGSKRTTHLGSSAFPRLTLIDAPPDRRRSGHSS